MPSQAGPKSQNGKEVSVLLRMVFFIAVFTSSLVRYDFGYAQSTTSSSTIGGTAPPPPDTTIAGPRLRGPRVDIARLTLPSRNRLIPFDRRLKPPKVAKALLMILGPRLEETKNIQISDEEKVEIFKAAIEQGWLAAFARSPEFRERSKRRIRASLLSKWESDNHYRDHSYFGVIGHVINRTTDFEKLWDRFEELCARAKSENSDLSLLESFNKQEIVRFRDLYAAFAILNKVRNLPTSVWSTDPRKAVEIQKEVKLRITSFYEYVLRRVDEVLSANKARSEGDTKRIIYSLWVGLYDPNSDFPFSEARPSRTEALAKILTEKIKEHETKVRRKLSAGAALAMGFAAFFGLEFVLSKPLLFDTVFAQVFGYLPEISIAEGYSGMGSNFTANLTVAGSGTLLVSSTVYFITYFFLKLRSWGNEYWGAVKSEDLLSRPYADLESLVRSKAEGDIGFVATLLEESMAREKERSINELRELGTPDEWIETLIANGIDSIESLAKLDRLQLFQKYIGVAEALGEDRKIADELNQLKDSDKIQGSGVWTLEASTFKRSAVYQNLVRLQSNAHVIGRQNDRILDDEAPREEIWNQRQRADGGSGKGALTIRQYLSFWRRMMRGIREPFPHVLTLEERAALDVREQMVKRLCSQALNFAAKPLKVE